MNEITDKLAPCPFCGWHNIRINPHRVGGYVRTGTRYQTVCSRCKSRGPIKGTEQEAEEAWNNRVK
ncbi:restriction alleviation protein, Lar family [Terrimicrobium sacchariphilum]|uniref:Restriction alleviation protein, Lar family n=1 Tax=Terrimicrobium sacchariphilum TaxID=690879 RepID=A0A146G7E0_TERSA|nr:restriction alleviation protein, Lar family [Terrimicrobium sacchariphilum]